MCYLVYPYAIVYTSTKNFHLITIPGIYFVEWETECWHEDCLSWLNIFLWFTQSFRAFASINLELACIVSTFFSHPITQLYTSCAGRSVLKEVMKFQCCYKASWEVTSLMGLNSWKYGMPLACISIVHFFIPFIW